MPEAYNEWYEVSLDKGDGRCDVCREHKILIVHFSNSVSFLHSRIGFEYSPSTPANSQYIHAWFVGDPVPRCLNYYKLVKKEKI
jgi:hypothetical protein